MPLSVWTTETPPVVMWSLAPVKVPLATTSLPAVADSGRPRATTVATTMARRARLFRIILCFLSRGCGALRAVRDAGKVEIFDCMIKNEAIIFL